MSLLALTPLAFLLREGEARALSGRGAREGWHTESLTIHALDPYVLERAISRARASAEWEGADV